MKLILGSQSYYRAQTLKQFGYTFEVKTADIDEKAVRHTDPIKLTVALARAKRRKLMNDLVDVNDPTVLITSDTVIFSNNRILEKPVNIDEAREMFEYYKKNPVHAVTAVAGARLDTGVLKDGFSIATFNFKGLTPEIIEELITSDHALKCAGGFTLMHAQTLELIHALEGDMETIVGMPRELTQYIISKLS